MRTIGVVITAVAVFLLSASVIMAQDVSKTPPVKAYKAKAIKDMTKDELTKEIETQVDYESGVLRMMPQLKKEKGANGKEFHTFRGVKLEEMKKEDLQTLLSNVYSQANTLRTEAINRQLENIRNVQRVSQMPRQPQALPPKVQSLPTQPQSMPPSMQSLPTQPQSMPPSPQSLPRQPQAQAPRIPSTPPSPPPAPPRR